MPLLTTVANVRFFVVVTPSLRSDNSAAPTTNADSSIGAAARRTARLPCSEVREG